MAWRDERLHTGLVVVLFVAALLHGAWPHLRPQRPVPEYRVPDLTVSVSGAVAAPGSYQLPWGARVQELIQAAGGLTPDAATELVAFADPLVDGRTVHVPAAAPGGDPRISVNEGSLHELIRLPGVGPAIADRIVAGRPYHRIDDLLRVRGIGPATLERLRDRVRL